MIGFLAKVAWGAGKLGLKYIVAPAVISVAVIAVADALATRIRASTSQANVEQQAVLPGF